MSDEHNTINRLRAENVALHKVILDAMAELDDDTPIPALSGADEYALHATDQIAKALQILDSAPEPDDETLAAIEDTGGDDA